MKRPRIQFKNPYDFIHTKKDKDTIWRWMQQYTHLTSEEWLDQFYWACEIENVQTTIERFGTYTIISE